MYIRDFFEPESMYAIMAWNFPIWYFLSVALSESMSIFAFSPSSSLSNSFPMLFTHSAFFLMFSSFLYFAPKLICFLVIRSLVSSYNLPLLAGRIFLVVLDRLFCLNCFTLSRNLFSIPSFATTFWFISSSCIVYFSWVAFSFFVSCSSIFLLFYYFCLL